MAKVTQKEIVEALNALACLGNGNTRGNSIGNDIAGDLLDKIQANGIAPPDGWVLVPVEPSANATGIAIDEGFIPAKYRRSK